MASRDGVTATVTAGTIVLLAVAVLVGAGLAVGPVAAQETTQDGMDDGNETDGESMNEEETMDDGTMTDDGMTTEDDMTGEETMGGMTTEDEIMNEGAEGASDETVSDGQPGFGLAVGAVALLAAVGYALYRRER